MSSPRPITVEDMTRIVEAYRDAARRVVEEFDRMAKRIWRALRPLVQVEMRARHVARFGPGNVTEDGAWLTDLCAAWVHGACPSPGHCDCRCHR